MDRTVSGKSPSEAQKRTPRVVAVYTAALAGIGVGLGAASARLFGLRPPSLAWTPAALLLLLIAAAYLILRVQYRNQVMALDLFEAVLAPTMFAYSGLVVVAFAAVGIATAELIRRNRPIKAFFNVAQWTCAAGAGSLVLDLLRSGSSLSPRNQAALLVAMTVVAATNMLAFAFVIRLAEREPVWTVLTGLAPSMLTGWAINSAFGLLFVFSFHRSPIGVAMFLIPLVVLHGAYRGHASGLAERSRLRAMHQASMVLANPMNPMNPRAAIPGFLAEIRQSFECEAVDLGLVGDDTLVVHRLTAEGYRETTVDEVREGKVLEHFLHRPGPARAAIRDTNGDLTSLLKAAGWRDCLGAPLVTEERIVGVLCTYNRSGPEGFEDGELRVLEALAGEAAGAIHKAELLEAVFEEQRKLSEIVNQTSDGIVTLGPDGTVMNWNPGLEQISGLKASEIVGTRLLSGLRARDAEGKVVMIERWAENGKELPSDVQIVTRAGDERWLSCSYTRVTDADDRPSLLIVVARDITKHREIEMLKEDFVATVSHELRTPLTPIKGFASMLMERGAQLDEQTRGEGARRILRQAERLERLIMNLLEVSSIDNGKREHRNVALDARWAVDKVVEEFRANWPERDIRMDAGPAPLLVRGDDLCLEQVVSNLLSNALKYAPGEEPIEVRVFENDGEVRVCVSDRGPGIPSHEMDRIFERFYRIGDHLKRAGEGAGLGLYISRRLAEMMGASLGVQSVVGQGTTFTISLQRALMAGGSPEPGADPEARESSEPDTTG